MERVRGSAERVQKWGNRRGLIWFQWNVCWQCSVARGLGINDWTLRLSKPEDFCGLVFLCALFCWREGSSQLIDTELSMKRTKRSPLLPWLASPPQRGGSQPVKGYSMKHTHTHTHTNTCAHAKHTHAAILRWNQTSANIQAWIHLQKKKKREENEDKHLSRWPTIQLH